MSGSASSTSAIRSLMTPGRRNSTPASTLRPLSKRPRSSELLAVHRRDRVRAKRDALVAQQQESGRRRQREPASTRERRSSARSARSRRDRSGESQYNREQHETHGGSLAGRGDPGADADARPASGAGAGARARRAHGSPRASASARRWNHSITGAGKSKPRRRSRWRSRRARSATPRSRPRSAPRIPTNFRKSSLSPSSHGLARYLDWIAAETAASDAGAAAARAFAAAGRRRSSLAARAPPQRAEPKLLPNERAFAFSARGARRADASRRGSSSPTATTSIATSSSSPSSPGTLAGAPALPPGKVKDDEFFGKVETYRGQVVVRLPLDAAAPGRAVTVNAESQGCADARRLLPAAGRRR